MCVRVLAYEGLRLLWADDLELPVMGETLTPVVFTRCFLNPYLSLPSLPASRPSALSLPSPAL